MRLAEYAQYATLTQGRESIHAALWDTLLYTTGVTTNLVFFQQTQAAVGLDFTNMTTPGQLPYPRQFLIRAGRFYLKGQPWSTATASPQTGSRDNLALLVNTGLVVITIGNKEYGRYPLHVFSTGGGPYGQINVQHILVAASHADFGVLGIPHAKSVYTFAKPMLIETSQNFNVTISWPAGFVAPTASQNICFALEGDEIRPVQ